MHSDFAYYGFGILSAILGYYWGRRDTRHHRERLDRIKALMREQNERVVARQGMTPKLSYETLWVDIWVEVAPHEDR